MLPQNLEKAFQKNYPSKAKHQQKKKSLKKGPLYRTKATQWITCELRLKAMSSAPVRSCCEPCIVYDKNLLAHYEVRRHFADV